METATKRIQTYKKETEPLVQYYTDRKLIVNIDGDRNINDVFDEITGVLGSQAKI